MTAYLTIDTSDRSVIGLVERGGGGACVAKASWESPDSRHHAETLVPMVSRILDEAGVERPDAVVAGRGPGAFTGLRAGLMTARMLAAAWGLPVYGAGSLEALAVAGVGEAGEVLALVDARRRELFALRARRSGVAGALEVLDGPRIVKPADVAAELERRPARLVVSREGLYPRLLGDAHVVSCLPEAMVARVEFLRAQGCDAVFSTEPLYLRRPDIHGGGVPQPSA